jgi:hypothetical protein
MTIDWAALVIVAIVSVVATVTFALLLAMGVRLVSAAKVRGSHGESTTAAQSAGYAFLGCAGLLVLFCLYLIVPQFH